MELNTREIAAVVWFIIILMITLTVPSIRKSFFNITNAFMQKKILQVLLLTFFYIGLIICLLYCLKIWGWDQLKNTIIWIFSIAMLAVFRSNRIPDDLSYFRKWITDNFKILAFVQFFVTLYTYPLWVELVVIPLMATLGGMIAVGRHKSETKSLANSLNNLLGWFSLAFFGAAVIFTIMDFWNYATVQTWRDFYTPILLTILFLPFIFLLHVVISYETTFLSLHFNIKDEHLRRSAKWRAVLTFGPNINLLNRWKRHVGLHRPQSLDDIKAGLKEIRETKRREGIRLTIPPEQGWSPPIAILFLNDFGLSTNDYHRTSDHEWSASSAFIKVGSGIISNNIAYYINGNIDAVTTLKLKLNINEPNDVAKAEAKFAELSETLVNSAIGDIDLAYSSESLDLDIGIHRVQIIKTRWKLGEQNRYDKILAITVM